MDGTLVDSEVTWNEAETEMFAARGIAYTQEIRANIIGLRVDEMMVKLKGMLGLPETVEHLVDELNTRMLAIIPTKVVVKPGAEELVQYTADANIPRAIASSSSMAIINAVVAAMGWEDAIPQRFSADDDARGKPAPDVYLRAAQTMRLDPADCLAIEDSPNGARAAVAAGMTCFAVPDLSHSTPEAFAGITPHVFADLHEVLKVLH